MAICPVCEHAQESGGDCDVCGWRLLDSGALDEPAPTLADLEPTRHQVGRGWNAERMDDLEPTVHAAAGGAAPREVHTPWLERTCTAAEDAPPRDLLAAAICRYCRTPSPPGQVFCSRCGLKLTPYSGEPLPPAGSLRRCRMCGAGGEGEVCPACGARLPLEA
jgi:ribosomal protein L40E